MKNIKIVFLILVIIPIAITIAIKFSIDIIKIIASIDIIMLINILTKIIESLSASLSWPALILIIFILKIKHIDKLLEFIPNRLTQLRVGGLDLSFTNDGYKLQINQLVGVDNEKSSSLKDKKIIWVDDNPDNNKLFRLFFKANGADITIAENTDEALSYIKKNKYDIIISDMHRNVDGESAGRELLKEDVVSKIKNKYIFCSNYNATKFNREKEKNDETVAFSVGGALIKKIIMDINS